VEQVCLAIPLPAILAMTRRSSADHQDASPASTSQEVNHMSEQTVNVRYMVNDVDAAVEFYTTHFGFELRSRAAPAFADVVRGNLRLLLSGPKSSAGRPMPDGRRPSPGGWNRIEFVVDDIEAEVERLRSAGLAFRNDIVTGPGGRQILLEDPSGNPIELFQPAPA
jgi:catechol 2,3-dioxygenase-like lactoylglutathione lyase family enzyme